MWIHFLAPFEPSELAAQGSRQPQQRGAQVLLSSTLILCGKAGGVVSPALPFEGYPLRRSSVPAPSCTTYSLRSTQALPLDRASAIDSVSKRDTHGLETHAETGNGELV